MSEWARCIVVERADDYTPDVGLRQRLLGGGRLHCHVNCAHVISSEEAEAESNANVNVRNDTNACVYRVDKYASEDTKKHTGKTVESWSRSPDVTSVEICVPRGV